MLDVDFTGEASEQRVWVYIPTSAEPRWDADSTSTCLKHKR